MQQNSNDLLLSVTKLISKMDSNNNNNNKNDNSNQSLTKITQRDTINEIYEFNIQFDGKIGETALKYRDNVVNYVLYVKKQIPKYYDENRIMIRITKSLTGAAAQKYNNRNGERIDKLKDFLIWFDTTFKLNTLRQEIYQQLKSWTIKPETNNLSIIDEYRQKLNLFDQTIPVSSKSVIAATAISKSTMISTILKAIQNKRPELYRYIDNYMMNFNISGAPTTLKELAKVIENGVQYLQSKQINSNDKYTDPTEMGSINSISINEFPELKQNQNQSNYNNYNYNQNNYTNQQNLDNQNFNNNQYYDNSNYPNNQNKRNNNYNQNRRNNYRGRGRFRGRGRGRGRGRKNNRYKNDKQINRDKNKPRTYNTPRYYTGYCRYCKYWGHLNRECNWIHQKYNLDLLETYASRDPNGAKQSNDGNTINATQQQINTEQSNSIDTKLDNFYDSK